MTILKLTLAVVFLSSHSAWADFKNIQELGAGPPALMSTVLHPSVYKTSIAHELAHPELLWLNFNWLREKGYKIPAEGVTPELLKEIYHSLGYQIPGAGDAPEAFLPNTIKVYADGYGADDTKNLGSGRAASQGEVQSKGVGKTDHVRETNNHSSGAAFAEEGIKEAFYGEVLHNEVATGANRIVAVIATGTTVREGDKMVPRVLIIREDPVRPAQFIRNYKALDPKDSSWDVKRVEDVIERFPDALPQAAGNHPETAGLKLKQGLEEFTNRLALQLADFYTLRLQHGASSVSNVVLDGRTIDYGSFTGLDGWTRLQRNSGGKPFGDIGEAIEWILNPLMEDLQKNIPEALKPFLVTPEAARAQFRGAYEKLLPERILKLTGTPPELIEELKTHPGSRKLGETLLELTKAGNEKLYLKDYQIIGTDSGKYRVGEIMRKLASGGKLRASDVSDPVLRERLSKEYSAYAKRLKPLAASRGISPEALRVYMTEAAQVVTRKTRGTYDTTVFAREREGIWEKFQESGKDRSVVQDFIDRRVEENSRAFKDATPLELVIHQKSDAEHGIAIRRVYNAKDAQYYSLVRVANSDGRANFFGNIVSAEDLEKSALTYDETGKATALISAKKNGLYTEFRIPHPQNTELMGTIRLRIPGGASLAVKPGSKFEKFWEESVRNGADCGGMFNKIR